jgi:hypothetical protein
MGQHLDDPHKTCETVFGRAVLFHWIKTEDLNKVERTWIQIHEQHEGVRPILNRTSSPVFA